MEEKELFEDYELKGWKLTPKIYKIVAAAAIFELFAFVIVGQFNLLQTKACDNAYVGKVCQVLDAVYVGTSLLDNGEWTSKPYVKNTFDEMDVAYVDVTNAEPPFTYPDGYFALANPEITELTNQDLPPDELGSFPPDNPIYPINKPPTPDKSLINRPPVLPKPNKNPVKGDIPKGLYTFGDDNKNTVAKNPSSKPTPSKTPDKPVDKVDPKDTTAANKDGDPTKPKSEEELLGFQPNKKPLEDLRDAVKEKLASKDSKDKVDLKAPFSITIDGVLTKDGKLDPDPKKTHYINPQGDQKMVDLAKTAIEAVNASGLFVYLDKLGGKRIIITIQQDQDNFSALLKSKIDTEEQAKTLASGFKLLLSTGKMLRKGKDEEVLLNSATVSNQGKDFIINFAVPQQMAQDLIQKQLTAPPEENKTEPNTTTPGKNIS